MLFARSHLRVLKDEEFLGRDLRTERILARLNECFNKGNVETKDEEIKPPICDEVSNAMWLCQKIVVCQLMKRYRNSGGTCS